MKNDKQKSETEFTPGPWKFSFESSDPEWAIVTAAGRIVSNVNSHHCQEGNARLISAAPELLEAAEKVLEFVTFFQEMANAENDNHVKRHWNSDVLKQEEKLLKSAILKARGGGKLKI